MTKYEIFDTGAAKMMPWLRSGLSRAPSKPVLRAGVRRRPPTPQNRRVARTLRASLNRAQPPPPVPGDRTPDVLDWREPTKAIQACERKEKATAPSRPGAGINPTWIF